MLLKDWWKKKKRDNEKRIEEENKRIEKGSNFFSRVKSTIWSLSQRRTTVKLVNLKNSSIVEFFSWLYWCRHQWIRGWYRSHALFSLSFSCFQKCHCHSFERCSHFLSQVRKRLIFYCFSCCRYLICYQQRLCQLCVWSRNKLESVYFVKRVANEILLSLTYILYKEQWYCQETSSTGVKKDRNRRKQGFIFPGKCNFASLFNPFSR